MFIDFKVLGEPYGKKNMKPLDRGKYLSMYSPSENKNYMAKVLTAFQNKYPLNTRFADDEMIVCTIKAYFTIPKSTSKKKTIQMINQEIRPTKRCDCDNISKVILDALNKIVFRDDSQIISEKIDKFYTDNTPFVEVILESYEPYKHFRENMQDSN